MPAHAIAHAESPPSGDHLATAAAKLRQAATLAREAAALLNARAPKCPGCHRKHAENFTEFKANNEVWGCSMKLDRWADTLSALDAAPSDDEPNGNH